MSILLNNDDVEAVLDTLTPAIKAFLAQFAKREDLAIRVLDPAYPNETVVLAKRDLGNTLLWEHNYAKIAMGKAEVCQRNKCDSEVVKIERPFCYKEGDPPFTGGVYVHGLVVACSGVEGYFDQMFARWIAASCRAIATHRLEKEVVAGGLDAIPKG